MNEVNVFENQEFGQVRTVIIESKIYFVGIDIAKSLGYSIPHKAVRDHCKGVLKQNVPTNGGEQEVLVITEGDVYRLIMKSKLPNAINFESWVMDEVLPSIRQTGSYQKPTSAIGQLQLHQQAILEVNEKVDEVKQDLESFKQSVPLYACDMDKITTAVRKKGVNCLGGKESNSYSDKSLRGKVYSDIYDQLKRQFGVSSYKSIRREQCELAVGIINNYELPIVLKEEVLDYNMQMHF
ncbi:ORF6C domain-containing protein [Anaerosporobacter sp.]|uniref:ORF6C domain-containing protein n=1 Tax=Anaerosporobacter sp. TaxID=1872529 RepID=UPI00286FA6B2|nr:ORF6C domain-containing protein [Anaerosporobacter sp.]